MLHTRTSTPFERQGGAFQPRAAESGFRHAVREPDEPYVAAESSTSKG